MIEVKIKQEAVEHLAAQGCLDLETAEQVLQECLSICEIRESPHPDGVGELFRAAEAVLKWRAKVLLISLPYKPEMDGLAYALTDLSTALQKFRQGSASKRSLPGE
jgi:hypothetical protein